MQDERSKENFGSFVLHLPFNMFLLVLLLLNSSSKRYYLQVIFKAATKLSLMYSQCVIIILFNTDFYRSAFYNYSFKKLVFGLYVFYVFCLFLFELDLVFAGFLHDICVIIIYISTKKRSLILFSPMSFSVKLPVLTLLFNYL